MHETFDEDELQSIPQQRDAELTLGPKLLLGLFFGLVLLCGLCFGLGYAMGSHGTQNAPSVQQTDVQAGSPENGLQPKPSAASKNIAPPQPADADASQSETSGTDTSAEAPIPDSNPVVSGNSNQPVVKPALPVAVAVRSSPNQAASTPRPVPVAAPTRAVPIGTVMVQVATVAHQEDADVLVGALQRRGYAVSVRRDATDNQFHVRIGPFAKRNDAYATREKLLNDGYNAIVQP